ncbi:MAG: MarR family transcriptional regulator [Eubacteriales bacterium]|jgi:DNA-binding MarR family transcriptional regulator
MRQQIFETVNRLFHNLTVNELQMVCKKYPVDNMTYTSLLYLDLVYCNPGKYTASAIADLLHVSKPGVITRVNELIQKGYLYKKQSDTDKRAYYLYVDEKAAPAYAFCRELDMSIAEELAQTYTPEQVGLFCRMLDHMGQLYLEKGEKV